MHDFAIIGAGFIGRVHARCLADSPRARLALVHDANPDAARQLADTYGAASAPTVAAILADESIAAVVIAASTEAHGELARACIRAGKPFLCEKPLDSTLASARQTVAMAKEAAVMAGLGFNRRFDRQHAILRRAVADGDIGSIEMMHLTSRSPTPPQPDYVRVSGGQLRDKGAHFFDLACWIAQDRPVEVYAVGACLFDPRFAELGDVDTAMIILQMSGGALCHLNFSRRTAYGYDERIEVFGAEGRIDSCTPVPVDVALYKGRHIRREGLHQTWFERIERTYGAQMDAFISELETRAGNFPTLEDGLVAEVIAEAGLRSMATRRSVPINYVVA